MSVKKRKRNKAQAPISISTVLLVFILLAIVAAIAAYYITKKSTPRALPRPVHILNQKELQNKKPSLPKAKPGIKNPMEGTWVSRSDGAILEVHSNKFSIDLPSVDSHNFQQGVITTEGAKVIFIFTGDKNPCKEGRGVYTFKIVQGSLHFKVEKDNCQSRKEKIVAVWDRFSTSQK